MLNFNLFENINLYCSCFKKKNEEIEEIEKNEIREQYKIRKYSKQSEDLDQNEIREQYKIREYSKQSENLDQNEIRKQSYNISILSIDENIIIDNLYPPTDHVELWNIFIVGSDKTYILANIKDNNIYVPSINKLPNHTGQNILPPELFQKFETIWDKTLSGKQLQFYMVWNTQLYFINTYPFNNGKNKVIGAILFMRIFDKNNQSISL